MFGPTRYQWDSGYYQGAIERSVQTKLASNKSVEQVGARVAGGVLAGSVFSNIRTVIQFARRAQLGEMIDFDREVHHSDGVFRSSPRGWFAFAHVCLGFLFLFGHWWHGARTLYRDVFSGIDTDSFCQRRGIVVKAIVRRRSGVDLNRTTLFGKVRYIQSRIEKVMKRG